jgi:hypothetical protein
LRSSADAASKPTTRSRVTNGRSLFVSADARSPWARRYKDLVELFADDAGGVSSLTELRVSIIRRAAALTVECERMEGELADGRPVDIDALARTSGHLRRLAETVGLNRVKRDVTPTIADIVARHRDAGTKQRAAS